MAATFYQADLADRVRKLIDEQPDLGDGTAYVTSGTLMMMMDVGMAAAWEDWSNADEGWNIQRTTCSLDPLTDGLWSLPTSVHKLRSVEAADGNGGWYPLDRATAFDDDNVSGGQAYAYRTSNSHLEVLPTHSSITNLRLTYTPSSPPLIYPTQEIPADDGFDQVVALRTAILLLTMAGRDTSGMERLLGEAMNHFLTSIKRRDRATPMKLPTWGGRGRRGRRRTRNL